MDACYPDTHERTTRRRPSRLPRPSPMGSPLSRRVCHSSTRMPSCSSRSASGTVASPATTSPCRLCSSIAGSNPCGLVRPRDDWDGRESFQWSFFNFGNFFSISHNLKVVNFFEKAKLLVVFHNAPHRWKNNTEASSPTTFVQILKEKWLNNWEGTLCSWASNQSTMRNFISTLKTDGGKQNNVKL